MDYAQDLDALGLLCPLPVLKTGKRLREMRPGEVLRVQADDPVAAVDIPHFCAEAGHELLDVAQIGAARHFFIRRR